MLEITITFFFIVYVENCSQKEKKITHDFKFENQADTFAKRHWEA